MKEFVDGLMNHGPHRRIYEVVIEQKDIAEFLYSLSAYTIFKCEIARYNGVGENLEYIVKFEVYVDGTTQEF